MIISLLFYCSSTLSIVTKHSLLVPGKTNMLVIKVSHITAEGSIGFVNICLHCVNQPNSLFQFQSWFHNSNHVSSQEDYHWLKAQEIQYDLKNMYFFTFGKESHQVLPKRCGVCV